MSNSHNTANDLQDFVIRTYDALENRLDSEQRIALIFSFLLIRMYDLSSADKNITIESLLKHLDELATSNSIEDDLLAVLLMNLNSFAGSEISLSFFAEGREFEPSFLKKELPNIFDKIVADKFSQSRDAMHYRLISSAFAKFLVDYALIREGESIHFLQDHIADFCRLIPETTPYNSNYVSEPVKKLAALKLKINQREALNGNSKPLHEMHSMDDTYDVILSTPPFGVRLNEPIKFGSTKLRTLEESALALAYKSLNSNGRLFALVSEGSIKANSGINRSIRKQILEEDLLDTVILLPQRVLKKNSNIGSTLLVLRKNKKRENVTRFINAESLSLSGKSGGHRYNLDPNSFREYLDNIHEEFFIDVNNDEIESSRFSFNPNVYLLKRYQDSLHGKPLSEVVSPVKGEIVRNETAGSIFKLSNLKSDKVDYKLFMTHAIEDTWIPKGSKLISDSVLLVGKVISGFNPSYYEGRWFPPIYVSKEIVALSVFKNMIDVEYLISELKSASTRKQLSLLSKGSNISMLTEREVLSLVVSVPPMGEQIARVKGFKEAMLEQKKDEIERFKKIHGLEKELKLQNSYLRHTLAGPVSNLKSMVANLSLILNDKVFHLYPELKNLRVSEKHTHNLEEYLNIVLRDIKSVHSLVKKQLNQENIFEGLQKSQIDMIEFLDNYVMEKKESGIDYELSHIVNNYSGMGIATKQRDKRVFIEGNREVLRILFDNLLQNAEKHGFKYSNYKRVLITSSYTIDDGTLTINVQNTGKPFPPGFDIIKFLKKGYSFGVNGGDGIGGWYYDKAIDYHGGDGEIVDETDGESYHESDFVTCFDIDLPISEIK